MIERLLRLHSRASAFAWLLAALLLPAVAAAGDGLSNTSRVRPCASGLQWSPSQKYLLTTMSTAGSEQDGIWILRADGSPLRRVSTSTELAFWVGNERVLIGREALDARPEKNPEWSILDLHGTRKEVIKAEAPEVRAWQVSPDGRYLAYVGSWPRESPFAFGGAVVLHRLSDRKTVKADISLIGSSMAWSPDSRCVYGPESDRDWRLDVSSGELVEKVRSMWFPGEAEFAVNNAGQMVVATGGPEGNGLNLIDWTTGKEQWIARGTFSHIAFGRDPNLFVCLKQSADADNEVWIGGLHGGGWTLSQFKTVKEPGVAIALSPDSKRLAYADIDGSVRVVPIPPASRCMTTSGRCEASPTPPEP